MSKVIRIAFFFSLVAGLIAAGAWWYFIGSQPGDVGQTVTIKNTVYTVEVADNVAERAIGLQHRSSLDNKHGMLFIFNEPETLSFWMKNTLIPLDFVWINDSTVVDITENVPTQIGASDKDLKTYSPNTPADKIIEFSAGTVKKIRHFSG